MTRRPHWTWPRGIPVAALVPALLLLLGAPVLASDPSPPTEALIRKGVEALARGDSALAVDQFLTPAVEQARLQGDRSAEADALLMQAEGLLALGQLSRATDQFERARDLLESTDTVSKLIDRPAALAMVHDRLGVAWHGRGEFARARTEYARGLEAIAGLHRPELSAVLLNDSGSLSAARGDFYGAIASFDDALRLADDSAPVDLVASIRLNLAAAILDAGIPGDHLPRIREALSSTQEMADGRRKAGNLIALGDQLRRVAVPASAADATRSQAYETYQAALTLAGRIDDADSSMRALGAIARLYDDERRWDESLQYSRSAVFIAQRLGSTEALYEWQWQVARTLARAGRPDESLEVYRQTLETLDGARADLAAGPRGSYRDVVSPVFLEYADLALAHTSTLSDQALAAANITAVQEVLEQVKVAEIQEYFQDECVARRQGRAPAGLPRHTAVIYPVILPQRIELLVTLADGVRQFTTHVDQVELINEALLFRESVQTYDGSDSFRVHAERLHDWLIGPIEALLEEERVTTVVFVPDGALRTIPMAALHDGERYLVQRYAVATTPGMTLTDARPLDSANAQVLASGLTQSVEGLPALANVSTELDNIARLYPAMVNRDEGFLTSTVETQLLDSDYDIVHVATHGKFEADHEKSYLLAWDEHWTMGQLRESIGGRQYSDEALELLVLSACETAVGDDRAALGLAGVALQAGARSALATLWSINDESTAELVSAFYRELRSGGNTKATALQTAQIQLIQDPRFAHPSYWAPFLLIGNWL